MKEELKKIKEEFQREIKSVTSRKQLEELKVKYLGRKSGLTALFARIPTLAAEERGAWGKELNSLKKMIEALLNVQLVQERFKEEELDLTFPSAETKPGSLHIISQVSREICAVFEKVGFAVIEGDQIEDEWHNFDALNFPKEHPSRDNFDTFYLDLPEGKGGKYLLRCHTSPSQIRVMQRKKPPLAVISPGRVYRPDQVDASHSFMFHQVEGFVVDTTTNFSHLKGVLLYFAQEFFSPEVSLRFRPHFFPFTEPSAEVDISCIICGGRRIEGKKCSVCKGKGWLEILGCGMIHPKVLEYCGIDSKAYQGFAFGMGVDRIAMLKYGIDDIRLFYENDVRFLNQFKI